MAYAADLKAKVSIDTREFDRGAAGVHRTLEKLAGTDPVVSLKLDDAQLHRDVQAAQRALVGIDDETVGITGDASDLTAEVRGVSAALAGIEDESVGITADGSDARSEVQSVTAALAGIEDEQVGITADGSLARSEAGSVAAALAGLPDESVAITGDGTDARAETQSVAAALSGIPDEEVRVAVEGAQAQAEVQAVESALAGLEDQTVRVNVEAEQLSSTLSGLSGGIGDVAGSARGAEASVAGSAGQMLGLGAAADLADGKLDMLGGRFGNVASAASALKFGVAGIVANESLGRLNALGMEALNLSDTINGTKVIFRDAAGVILDFGETAADALGVSQQTALGYSNSLGTLLQGLGYSAQESADMTVEAFTRANDVSSATGRDRAQVIEAMISAYAGEREAIKSIIGAITEEEVNQRALSMGLADTTKAIDAQDKAMATHAIIMEKSAMFAGDFARTQDEGLNAVARSTAALDDAKAAWGDLFAPAVEAGAKALKDAAERSQELIAPIQAVGGVFADVWNWAAPVVNLQDNLWGAAKSALGFGDAASGTVPPVRDLSAEQYNLAESLRTGRPAADGLASGLGEVGDKAASARREVEPLSEMLDRLIGRNLSAESASIRFEQSLQGVTNTLRENGHHLDGNSEKQLRSRSEVVSAAQAALSHVEALRKQGVGTDAVNQALGMHRANLVDAMVAGGMAKDAALDHVNALGLNYNALTQVADSTGDATAKTDAWKAALDRGSGAVDLGKLKLDNWKASLGLSATESQTAKEKLDAWKAALDGSGGAADTTRSKTDNLRGSVELSGGAAFHAGGRFAGLRGEVHSVPGDKTVATHTPGLGAALGGMRELSEHVRTIGREVSITVKSAFGFGSGDGPGGPVAPRGGPMINRVRAILPSYPGLRVTSTYRDPARNRAAGGAPTSYHLDRANPAVDVGGPAWQLDRLHAALRSSGGLRELLWRTAGHYDHLHVAHAGGIVDRAWGTLPGLRHDERPVITQVGEGILSRSDMSALAGLSGGSSRPVPVAGPSIVVHVAAGVGAGEVEMLAYRGTQRALAEHDAENGRMLRAGVRVG